MRLTVASVLALCVAWGPMARAHAEPLPSPSDFVAGGGSFSLVLPCRVRASVFVDNLRVPDGSAGSAVTAYYQMESQPDDGRGGHWAEPWATWDQPASRHRGWGEMSLYRQDIHPLSFERGYVGHARRWQGVAQEPMPVPPTNLPYSVWSYGFKTFGPAGQRQDWRVVTARNPNGAPPGALDGLESTVRKSDLPAQPLPVELRGGAVASGPPDQGILRLAGADGRSRAWTRHAELNVRATGLDATCTSLNSAAPAQRDAATHPACEPDPVTFSPCWDRAAPSQASPPGRLDLHADGTFGRSPYCAHVLGHVQVYRNADRSDCPALPTLSSFRSAGLLPSWWCVSKTSYGFCAESQVDWVGHRQQRVWLHVRDLGTGAQVHDVLRHWYGDPQGNVSQNACPRNADGSARFGDPRTCFYEGWWHGSVTLPLPSDGPHPLAIDVVDDTFRSWLAGAPLAVQNRSSTTSAVHRDTVGPLVHGSMDAQLDGDAIRFVATDIRDPGDIDHAVGVNRDDIWVFACRRGSPGCGLGSVPEAPGGEDRISMRMLRQGGSYSATAAAVPGGEWLWKVVPHDLLGNRGDERHGPMAQVLTVEAVADAVAVEAGSTTDVDVVANDIWAPSDAVPTLTLVSGPARGEAVLVAGGGAVPVVRYHSDPATPDGTGDVVRYRLCVSAGQQVLCDEADLTIDVRRPPATRRPT